MEQYTVQKGDSLWKISRKFELMLMNWPILTVFSLKQTSILSSPVRY
ncbi:LysM peptidoglycan-binding domain-containing protein [Klebsiella pneumoniae]|uniref:LysM peptidoglycan-binding domain-containing protein n=1 Tax=Klebsiella pneumoniae TaxID=573 RepID=A0A939NNI9_KLEPN|nr:LysM peptidoglycan-binding domain-containing protein [Klebsiella pneumoniae]